MSLYRLGKFISACVLYSTYRVKIIGGYSFPKEEGVLLCSNHISNLDPPLVGVACPRPVHFMAKSELFDAPILKSVLPRINAFPVKRGMSDKQALRTGLQLLREHKVLGLFPEGTRSKTGEVGKGLAGAGFFALRTEAKIIPCAIIGPYRPFSVIKVVFGEPIDFKPLKESGGSAQDASDLIMNRIGALIEKNRN